MTFDGPDRRDYDNVASLNFAYLSLVRRDSAIRPDPALDPAAICERIADLDNGQIRRLAETPLLLFSFREVDERYWTRILENAPVRDLFSLPATRDIDTLVSGALGFLWQLARRNPYALRLICGATMYWCERIAEQTFFRLLSAVRQAGDIPAPRLAHSTALWNQLLLQGTSRRDNVRSAAQFGALQAVLTAPQTGRLPAPMPRAARQLQRPGHRVADENDPHSQS
jgi:hypothetical protein